MPMRHRAAVGIVVVAIAAACSDASGPSTPPTLTLSFSSDTVAPGDTVAATVTGRQAQSFNYRVTILGEFGNDTLGLVVDSTAGGSTLIQTRMPVVAPQAAAGHYLRFTATDSAYGFPTIETIDSVLVTQ